MQAAAREIPAPASRPLQAPRLKPLQGTLAPSQNWKLLGIFNVYRLAVAGVALGVAVSVRTLPPFGTSDPVLFELAGAGYFLLAIGALLTTRWRKPDFDTQVGVLAFADVVFLTLLMHASGGLSSGLGLLLIVAVAGSSLMLGRKVAIFYAALATVAAMLQHSWGLFFGQLVTTELIEGYPQVGLLGTGLFATAFLGYTLAARLRATEVLAQRRGADLAHLARINELIIQRMQAGVLACDRAGHVRFINQAAQRFLGMRQPLARNTPITEVSTDLAIQLFQWLGSPGAHHPRRTFNTPANFTLLPRFVGLEATPETGVSVLVFLEDMAGLKRQAQQLKMSALARLTASIAHEIRNPLGAITSAAQLLAESVPASGEPYRLTKIIEEQSRRMNVIVQNVTQLSRRDRVSQVRLSLGTWLADFITQYCETARVPAEAFARVGDDIEVSFDPDQLNQVLTNLCQNALRHSPPFTGTALVKFLTGRDAEGRPWLDVIDWGTGVPPNIVDNIFDPFFTTTPKGTGLGLYIAKELCEGNGAAIDYHPGDGGVGSRFRITMARADEVGEIVGA
jgi:two-component system sensor histidine kinase PilS (NtrC family)